MVNIDSMKFANTVLAADIDNVGGVATIQGFEGLFENVIDAVLGLAGIVLFIMLIVGGFKYITSAGDPKAAAAARATLTHALLGIVLVASAYVIILLIQEFTGADLSSFEVYR